MVCPAVNWSRIFNFDISKVTGYTQKCDSIDFTTKAGRAGQTSGSGDNEVHEHVELRGSAGYLAGEMEHYAFPDIATWVEKHNRYSNWEARVQLAAQTAGTGDTAGLDAGLARKRRLRQLAWHLPFRPTLRFLYHYVWRAGLLDGYRGFVFCRLMAHYEFLCATKAAELRRATRSP